MAQCLVWQHKYLINPTIKRTAILPIIAHTQIHVAQVARALEEMVLTYSGTFQFHHNK